MLTATGQNQGISHGLQIGKDPDDSSQDANHDYQFNNIGFIDDISFFSETPEGMQTLLDVVQEFTTWCGMEINIKKTFLLVIDKDRKRSVSTLPNQKPPANARIFCRPLSTERNRRLPVLGSPHRMVAE